jgi:hypothetical protein
MWVMDESIARGQPACVPAAFFLHLSLSLSSLSLSIDATVIRLGQAYWYSYYNRIGPEMITHRFVFPAALSG